MPTNHIYILFASDLTFKVTYTNPNFFLVLHSTIKTTAMSTSRLNLRSGQFEYDSYSDFVRAEHPDNFSDTNLENLYWLYAAFQPYTVFPVEQFGVSIVEVVNGHIHLKWSSSFEMQDEVLRPLPNYPSTSTNAATELLRRIDNCGAAIEFRVIIVHCFPSVLHQRPRCCDYQPHDPAWEGILDVVGARFKIHPNLFIEHLARGMLETSATARLQPLPSERDYVFLKHPDGGHVTFTLCPASVNFPNRSAYHP